MYLQRSESSFLFEARRADKVPSAWDEVIKDSVFSFHRSSQKPKSLEAAVFSCAVLCAALLFPASQLCAQDKPADAPVPATAASSAPSPNAADYGNRWDVFGGFSYSYFTTTYGHALKASLYGASAEGTAWLNPLVGGTAALRWDSGTIGIDPNAFGITNPRISQTLFLFGPEIRPFRKDKWAIGGHVLIGGTYGIFSHDLKGVPPNQVGLYNDQLAFAVATGGTFDYAITPKLSIRLIPDFQPTFYGHSIQKDFAGQFGVAYKFGSLTRK
jgi:hypothetical protein